MCELVSESLKFPASREKTGNLRRSRLGGRLEIAKKSVGSILYEPIPYALEQGIYFGLTGNWIGASGNFSA